jgi:hypothetical protein
VVLDDEWVAVLAVAGAIVALLAALDVEVVAPSTFATVGLRELPPHPATRPTQRNAAATSRRTRGRELNRLG